MINTPIVDGRSFNGEMGKQQVQRLGEFYAKYGSDPRVVAQGIVKAVSTGRAHLHVGAKAPATVIAKRLSPSMTRRLSMRVAREAGYL